MSLQTVAGNGIVIEWTLPKLKAFKRAYDKALKDGKDEFTFEGQQFIVGYAKYLIEYLNGRLSQP